MSKHLFHESVFFVATSILDVSQFVKMLWFMSLCYEILIVVLSFFFSAVTSAFQLFTCKLCLRFSGLRMRNFTWNRFPIKNLLIDFLLLPIVESTYLDPYLLHMQWNLKKNMMPSRWFCKCFSSVVRNFVWKQNHLITKIWSMSCWQVTTCWDAIWASSCFIWNLIQTNFQITWWMSVMCKVSVFTRT